MYFTFGRSRKNSFEMSRTCGSQPRNIASPLTSNHSRNSSSNSLLDSRIHTLKKRRSDRGECLLLLPRLLKLLQRLISDTQKMDISEIDARLNALQEFMRKSLESAHTYSV